MIHPIYEKIECFTQFHRLKPQLSLHIIYEDDETIISISRGR